MCGGPIVDTTCPQDPRSFNYVHTGGNSRYNVAVPVHQPYAMCQYFEHVFNQLPESVKPLLTANFFDKKKMEEKCPHAIPSDWREPQKETESLDADD